VTSVWIGPRPTGGWKPAITLPSHNCWSVVNLKETGGTDIIPFSGPDFEKCEAPVKRLISKTSFILKGDGWYKDGY
jgi:hypothetical protein